MAVIFMRLHNDHEDDDDDDVTKRMVVVVSMCESIGV